MSYQANDQETCLFCLGEEEPKQPLQANKKCRCKYSYHNACYARYDRKEICPLCKRHEGQPNTPSPSPSAPPAVPPHHVTLTITLPRETTAPYAPLAQYTAPPHTQRKLTPLQAFYICLIVIICVAVFVGIITVFG